MRYDSIIIGGGMSGIIAGLRLIKAGQKVAIVSMGQSALHFSSGSLALLSHDAEGNVIDKPLEAIKNLSPNHPYSKIGYENIVRILPDVKPIFADAGIKLKGSEEQNHYRLTPIGMFKPAWLTMDEYVTVDDLQSINWGKTLIMNIDGFIDFYPSFIARGLSSANVDCQVDIYDDESLEPLRRSSTEMRATAIARALNNERLSKMAAAINRAVDKAQADTVLIPAVVGLVDTRPVEQLRKMVSARLMMVPTMPMSVGGLRAQICLRERFRALGGEYLLGDKVVKGIFNNDKLEAIMTENLGPMKLEADNFILATGSFFSHGLESTPDSVSEATLGLDVDAVDDRNDRCPIHLFSKHPYMNFGVATDNDFHAIRDGLPIDNLYAIGSILSGCDSLKEGSGAGVALLTAIHVADDIINKDNRNSK